MDPTTAIQTLRSGSKTLPWPTDSESQPFAESLDKSTKTFRDAFIVPPNPSDPDQEAVYFCGNSLGLQPKCTATYLASYLRTWSTIAVAGHFRTLPDSAAPAWQDLAAECAATSAGIVGARAGEVVVMNSLTVNLHVMMAGFYKPVGRRRKVMLEWRPFPSDYYAIESQIEWHGLDAEECMLKVEPDEGYVISTEKVLRLIEEHAEELALVLLPGIQYYSGQLLDIPTITKRARERGIMIGWDLAHAAGNVELQLHEWDVDFACWCTYKYMNAGAGAIAGAFVHERHGDNGKNTALKGWYGHDQSTRFLMDNKFQPAPGASGFQLSNPSIVDLTCLSATLSVFQQTSMKELRSKSLLLTAYAEHLLDRISERTGGYPFQIITPLDPLRRGAQLSVLIREELFEDVAATLEADGIVCDKRKPGVIRVAPAPLYNTFDDVWRFMQSFERALTPKGEFESRQSAETVEARL